jgi:hypothetical protein
MGGNLYFDHEIRVKGKVAQMQLTDPVNPV